MAHARGCGGDQTRAGHRPTSTGGTREDETMMSKRIMDVTADSLGEGATDDDLAAFKAACTAYLADELANPINPDDPDLDEAQAEEDAIDAIWGNGNFWQRVQVWAPDEATIAEAAWNK